MANNLKDHLKEVADAIRAKKGTTELINPQDFATEIEGISGSGGGESGSNVEYLDMTNVTSFESWMLTMLMASLFVKQQITLGGATINSVLPTFLSQSMRGDLLGVTQFAIDFKATIALSRDGMEQTRTVADFLISNGVTQEKLDAIPRITKEQFYDLNA